jgi:RNA 2',3'-cyclic 3'-phosphodiesterase
VPRLFVALPIPSAVQERLAAVQAEVKASGLRLRHVRPEGLHLTLAFLGPRPETDVPLLGAALHRAARGRHSFRLGVAGLGAFPHLDRPRVLWAGLTGELGALDTLRRAVWGEIEALPIPFQRQPFRPHVTLARIPETLAPDEARRLRRTVAVYGDDPCGEWTASEVHLMESELLSGGARYTPLSTAVLAETEPAGRHAETPGEPVERGARTR